MSEQQAGERIIEIGLSSWIIQDGNYADFHVGDRAEFAVEFYPESVNKTATASPALIERVAPAQYRARGSIVHMDSEVWVLDVGILAYQESGPAGRFFTGDSVEGIFYLGVDHFEYFERLYRNPQAPPLIYTWLIRQILIETAPLVRETEIDVNGDPRSLVRDPAKRGRRDIAETDAWMDDDGNADYVFVCELLDIPPKRSSVTALWP